MHPPRGLSLRLRHGITFPRGIINVALGGPSIEALHEDASRHGFIQLEQAVTKEPSIIATFEGCP